MPSENLNSHKCPKCGGERTRRSRRHSLDRLFSLAGRAPFRCRDCRGRFHLAVEQAPAQANHRSESRQRRRTLKRRELVVYALALVAFAVVAFVITLERG